MNYSQWPPLEVRVQVSHNRSFKLLNLMTQLDDASLFNKNMHILSQNLPCIFMFKPFWKDTVKNYASKKMFIPISFGNSAGRQYTRWPANAKYLFWGLCQKIKAQRGLENESQLEDLLKNPWTMLTWIIHVDVKELEI